MAKRFVRITLAAKCRLLFGAASVLIIGAALVVPWLYMEAMAEERVLQAGAEVSRLQLNEWINKHPQGNAAVEDVAMLFTMRDGTGVRRGPRLIQIDPQGEPGPNAGPEAMRALRAFERDPGERMVQVVERHNDTKAYRIYRALRARPMCLDPGCHDPGDTAVPPARQYQPNQLLGAIEVTLPGDESPGSLVLSRLVIIGAGVLAFLMASLTFYFITQKLILSPVRQLKKVADKVADGDLTARSGINTGDEFAQLGASFDEMLEAVTKTQDQLRTANRALDLKLNELAEANVALYESNRLKSEFLANVSHELRTPLNSIIGFAELLTENADDKVQRYGRNILEPARMLLRIINDLLDLARIEAGRVKLTMTRVSVADICETLTTLVTPLAQKRKLNLVLEPARDLPVLRTDAGKMQQILYNLLSNAIKFTPPGGEVRVGAVYDPAEQVVVTSVSDTGPGIPKAEQDTIFEQFYQSDSSATREHGGAGLGLAIARDLAELLGGKLNLESEPGQGATFRLTLPLESPTDEENGAAENSPRKG